MDAFGMNLADGSQQASVAVETEVAEKILEHSVQQRTLPAVESVLVLLGQLRAIVVDSVHFDEIVSDVALRSVLEVLVNVVSED